tara:strand:+ start:244 stop:951 length:708 start_codon:yes stop_codon:yes gene_type:complete
MCFSETHSYINAILLSSAGLYVLPEYKLTLAGIFFALKELLQGLLYKYLNNEIMLKYLSMASWVHICFQPLIVNILYSYFDPNNIVWKITFIIAFIFGIIMITELNEFDIQNHPDCIPDGRNDDFCSTTTAYMGKYHIAYRFKIDKVWNPFPFSYYYFFLYFIPILFTKARLLGIIHIFLTILIMVTYNYTSGLNLNSILTSEYAGEKAAIWCFLSIYIIPVILFAKPIKKMLQK